MQQRRNSIANALELRLFCIKPSKSQVDTIVSAPKLSEVTAHIFSYSKQDSIIKKQQHIGFQAHRSNQLTWIKSYNEQTRIESAPKCIDIQLHGQLFSFVKNIWFFCQNMSWNLFNIG